MTSPSPPYHLPHRGKAIRRLEVWCRVTQTPDMARNAIDALLNQEGVSCLVRFFSNDPAEGYALAAEGQRGSTSWRWEQCCSQLEDTVLWTQELQRLEPDCRVAWANDIDVPPPYRLYQTLKALEIAEMLHGEKTPLLVHSDAALCSADGTLLQPSWWAHQRAQLPPTDTLGWLVEPGVLFATTMINWPLAKQLMSSPDDVAWEHWVAAVARLTGQQVSLHEPLLFWMEQPGRKPAGRPVGERLFRGLPCSSKEGMWRWQRASRLARQLIARNILGDESELLQALSRWEQISLLHRLRLLVKWGCLVRRARWGWAQLIWNGLYMRRDRLQQGLSSEPSGHPAS